MSGGKQQLSFCMASWRREDLLLRCVESIVKAAKAAGVETDIVIARWDPEVVTDAELAETCGDIPLTILPMTCKFNLGVGKNAAADAALSDRLFFPDADMLVPVKLITTAMRVMDDGLAYFPRCWKELSPGGEQQPYGGTGNVFCLRSDWEAAGRWPTIEGPIDRVFCQWFKAHKKFERLGNLAPPVEGFVHLWHTQFNYRTWK